MGDGGGGVCDLFGGYDAFAATDRFNGSERG
jgi:hypothetical protein